MEKKEYCITIPYCCCVSVLVETEEDINTDEEALDMAMEVLDSKEAYFQFADKEGNDEGVESYSKHVEVESAIDKFVRYGEGLQIEVDTESERERVVPLEPDPNEENFRSILELSTGHAPSSVPDFGVSRFESHEYGWVVWVSEMIESGTPEWFRPILAEAIKRKCVMILFDESAPYFDGFKTYDW